MSQCDKCHQRHEFSRNEARGEGHADSKTASDTPRPQGVSLIQIILEICSGHDFSRIEARGQGHSDPKIVCDTPETPRCIHTLNLGFLTQII